MQNTSIFRIDKFVVPAASRERFLERISATHNALDMAVGCEENFILEQVAGPGQYNVVTFVKWKNQECYETAKDAATSRQAKEGFNPAAFMEELGIRADLGNYCALNTGR